MTGSIHPNSRQLIERWIASYRNGAADLVSQSTALRAIGQLLG